MVELSRRGALGALGAGAVATPLLAQDLVRLGFANGDRAVAGGFPEKGAMIVQRSRAPVLETPWDVYGRGVFTRNDRFYVRWHYSDIPLSVDVAAFRLRIGGAVNSPRALTLGELLKLPRVELAAVNQCAGNSRGHFTPRVAGAQWGHGAMGNARWVGVRLRDVLDLAGVRAGATAVRFAGLDRPPVEGAPWYAKSLSVDHARDGEVMIAFAMNGAALPMLNGFPIRLVVPGWYSTYWIKALDRIEVLTGADDNFWMAKAYRIPTTPDGGVAPGTKDFASTPIGAMVPRSFVTSVADGAVVRAGQPLSLGGLAMGGDAGVARVDLRVDGAPWQAATLEVDHGRYSFRRWTATLPPLARGTHSIGVRCTNASGVAQPEVAVWNPSGYQRGVIETIKVIAQ
ncbi:MAG: oxidase [Sphingomonas sp.]|nr:oxidase [Sphingomonas sp.]